MKMYKETYMNFHEWLKEIRNTGSENDMIWYKGENTSPLELYYKFGPLNTISDIRITYWSANNGMLRSLKKVRGTLAGMLQDRASKARIINNYTVGECIKELENIAKSSLDRSYREGMRFCINFLKNNCKR